MVSFWTYVFILDISLMQFGCLLLVCPLLCFFLLFVVVYLLLPDEDTKCRKRYSLQMSHRLSSIGEYIFSKFFSSRVSLTSSYSLFPLLYEGAERGVPVYWPFQMA